MAHSCMAAHGALVVLKFSLILLVGKDLDQLIRETVLPLVSK